MFGSLFGGFNINKLKPNLKMAVNRINIVKNKKINSIKSAKRQVANLLAEGKEEKARIRVEGIIRDDFTLEAYEIIELLCDLLAERAALMKTELECPYDMREAVSTLIWAADRIEISEMIQIKKQLAKKYGQDFTVAAQRNVDGCVNERVIHRLSVQPPNAFLVINYMKEIAKENNIDWEPNEDEIIDPLAPMAAPTGTSIGQAIASGPDYAAIYARSPPNLGSPPTALPKLPKSEPSKISQESETTFPPPAPTTNEGEQSTQGNVISRAEKQESIIEAKDSSINNSSDKSVPDFDELSARFEKLRNRQ